MPGYRVRFDGYYSDSDQGSSSSDDSSHWDDATFSDDSGLDQNLQPNFGILFDVDGVLALGSNPLDQAVQAVQLLKDTSGNLRVPVAFVTNACGRSHDKAKQISQWFNVPVKPDMVIHAPTPARLLTEYHDKHVLVIGQNHREEIAEDIGFNNTCTIEDIQKAYPFLDMVDHGNRERLNSGTFEDDMSFPRVEAILLIGEPRLWESNLQLMIDLLLTEGKPTHAPTNLQSVRQLPIIACNMDLVFKHRACMPRFGQGSFLVCLEALYKKITGRDLEYTALVGKPCEITYRYAEHTIAAVARSIGIQQPIKKLYFIGDNPHVDIVGANLYGRFLRRQSMCVEEHENGNELATSPLPRSRSIPCDAKLFDQTVEAMESLLVGTGVYKPESETNGNESDVYHGHRDIENEPELAKPSKFVPDVFHGIQYILQRENFLAK